MAATPDKVAMPIPTPIPIDAPVERPDLEFEVLVDAIVIDPAGGVDTDDTGDEEDDGPGEPVAELGDDDEDDDELELETSTPNSTTGKVSVWPRVAFGLLLQAAFIVSRTMTSAWLESPQEHTCLPPWRKIAHSSQAQPTPAFHASKKHKYLRLRERIRRLYRSNYIA